MQHPITERNRQWYFDDRSMNSFYAGRSLGMLLGMNNPNMSVEKLDHMISTLRVIKTLDIMFYQLGFLQGYVKHCSDIEKYSTSRYDEEFIHTNTRLEEVLRGMGKLSTAKANNTSLTPFVTGKALAEVGAVFCIIDIDRKTGKFGEQWVLTILLDEGSQRIIATAEDGTAKLSLSCSASRDGVFNELITQTPVHHATIDEVATRSGSSFYDVVECSQDCPCGELYTEDDEEEAADVQPVVQAPPSKKNSFFPPVKGNKQPTKNSSPF